MSQTPSPWCIVSIIHIVQRRQNIDTYVFAHIESLRDPIVRNARGAECREPIHVSSRRATMRADVAGEPRLVFWIADEEHTLDGVEC